MSYLYTADFSIQSKRVLDAHTLLRAMNGRLFKLAQSKLNIASQQTENKITCMEGNFSLVSEFESVTEKEVSKLFSDVSGIKSIAISQWKIQEIE